MRARTTGIIGGSFLLAVLALLALSLFTPAASAAAFASAAAPSAQAADATAYPPAPKLTAADYPTIKGINSRVTIWLVAQLHLWFGAFVLAVPIFVFIIEAIGMATRDERYDQMAFEFMKVSITAYSLTALLGGLLTFCLVLLYPDLFRYLATIFKGSMFAYALLFFAESAILYVYYYGWHWLQGGNRKWVHLTLGLLLNATGCTLMFLANAWTTFMMSPAAVNPAGVFNGDTWAAIHNFLWNPMNIHRLVANVAYGGSIIGAYAAFKFLSAKDKGERAHYDWIGYNANFIAIAALLPLPFAGYYLTAEMYAYSQQMGITLMGGVFAWIFIIQAVLIGALFLSANYYLWCGMGRSEGAQRYNPRIKYIAVVLVAAHPGAHQCRTQEPRRAVPPVPRGTRPDAGQEHCGEFPDRVHLPEFPVLPARQQDPHRVLGGSGQRGPGRAVRRRPRQHHAAGRLLRLLHQQRVQGGGFHPAGADHADHHRREHGHRRVHVQGGKGGCAAALGAHARALAIRAVPARRGLHLADGADGLRALRDPPALARAGRVPRQLGGCVHPGSGLCGQHRLDRHHHLHGDGHVHLLAECDQQPARRREKLLEEAGMRSLHA
jgi:hypothetical protein